ncbi:MAG: DUF5686 and carboxypeptidase regulatory-like domain-containing protein [Bacteroidota bacterium]
MLQRLLPFILLLCSHHLYSQLRGNITDVKDEPLAFASIYVQGSTNGTTSNIDGEYYFELPKGSYKIVFQYVGYRQKVVDVTVGDKEVELDVQLEAEAIELNEVVVKANAEDPAYPIIRKAIAKRDYYRKLVESYTCDVYIKGMQKLLDAPEKILGQEIGDLGGSLDSNRQGIVYLSESQALLHYRRPNEKKEQMISSKVSGNDNGFGFNQATLMDFNLYDSYIEVERQILSPIANNALSYYRYKLLGTLFDEEGRLINKIELIPKRAEDPVFSGYIYIVEDLWNIQSVELYLTGASIKQPILDSLIIKQVHVPVEEPDTWMMLSQNIDFKFGLFGFKVHGNFEGVFSNYELNKQFEKGFFNNELFRVEEGANEKDLTYWDSIRPIPLTLEEEQDYVKKDSLQQLWKSKPYMDSVDNKNNKFSPIDLLFGYTYSNSYKKRSISYGSPLTKLQFNTVQGYHGTLDFTLMQNFDDYNMRWFSVRPFVNYGLAEEKFRAGLELRYNFNRTKFTQLRLSGGQQAKQFGFDPVNPTLNTLWSLIGRKNFMKLYDKTFGRVDFRHELTNGVFLRSSAEYSYRRPLVNNSNHSIFNEDRIYQTNDPLNPANPDESFDPSRAFKVSVALRLRWKQKYITYPGRKFIMGSKLPDFWVVYTKALPITNSYADYDLLRVRIQDDFELGLVGFSEILVEGGTFLNDNRLEFVDFHHFSGNRYFISNPDRYTNGFLRLPFYEYSTADRYFRAHFEHNFKGYLLDKVPLLRKLSFTTVMGASFLYTEEQKDYLEVFAGLDNLGWGALRLFRVDVVSTFRRGKYVDTAVVFGIRL